MSYLLDTCVVSELVKPVPSQPVIAWLGGQRHEELFLSVLTIAEIQRGIHQLSASARRGQLQRFLDGLRSEFSERLLPVDGAIADRWAWETAKSRPLNVVDALIAATALVHGLTVVTRNKKDMPMAPIFNPWENVG